MVMVMVIRDTLPIPAMMIIVQTSAILSSQMLIVMISVMYVILSQAAEDAVSQAVRQSADWKSTIFIKAKKRKGGRFISL